MKTVCTFFVTADPNSVIYDIFMIEKKHKFKIELVQFHLYGRLQWKAVAPKIEHTSGNLWYSGTSVYVRFGISPTWYTSCFDAKNFAWYTTFVWNTTRVLELVWIKMSPDTACYSCLSLSRQNHDCPRASVRQLLPSFYLYFLWEQFVWYTSCLV
jgi:hypothetical protein